MNMNFLCLSRVDWKCPNRPFHCHSSVCQNQHTLDDTSSTMEESSAPTKRINSWGKAMLRAWVSTEEEVNTGCTTEPAMEVSDHTTPGPSVLGAEIGLGLGLSITTSFKKLSRWSQCVVRAENHWPIRWKRRRDKPQVGEFFYGQLLVTSYYYIC